jgi:hypothetical protein
MVASLSGRVQASAICRVHAARDAGRLQCATYVLPLRTSLSEMTSVGKCLDVKPSSKISCKTLADLSPPVVTLAEAGCMSN